MASGSYVKAELDASVTLGCLQCGWKTTYRPHLGRVSFVRMLEDDRDHYAERHASKERESSRA